MTARATPTRHALVVGAAGLIGRNLVLHLARTGVAVTATARSTASADRLEAWLASHGAPGIPTVRIDFDDPALLPGGPEAWAHVTEIHNAAGAYRFGMTIEEARASNVHTVERLVAFAARLPHLRRLVHVSGYRVGGQDPAEHPWSAERIRRTAARLGAYEASKIEADAGLRALATRADVPWSVVNPSTVIGDSATGESDQLLGLASSLHDLWRARMPALPGDDRTFVPVVTADHLAAVMASLPEEAASAGRSFWVLADDTPPLPRLLAEAARRYGVRAPRLRIPVALLRRLPASIARADPETLSFLSTDRYPTEGAQAHAERHGIRMPDTARSIARWADHLAAHRFGAVEPGARRFVELAGTRTFELGEPRGVTAILPGLPVDADTWAEVAAELPGARALDLPGLGLSPTRADLAEWVRAVLAQNERTHLIGHSLGAALALEAAAADPARVASLALVAPFFLQAPAPLAHRVPLAVRAVLRRLDPAALSRMLTGTDAHAASLAGAADDLRRTSAGTAARLLAAAADPRRRAHLRDLLAGTRVPVHIVVGSADPLSPDALRLLERLPHARVSVIDGAGHHPQLTHAAELRRLLTPLTPPCEMRTRVIVER